MVRLSRVVSFICAASSLWAAGRSHVSTSPLPAAQGQAAFNRLPLRFEQNQGQWDSSIQYKARSGGMNLSLTKAGPVVSFPSAPRLNIALSGSNPDPVLEGLDPLAARTSYFFGSRENWRAGIANFARVRYRSVYPGVDVVYYGRDNLLEYDFVLAPGADPNAIRMEFSGAEGLRIAPGGDLAVETAAGTMIQQRPAIYQEDPGTGARRLVDGRYVLLARNMVGVRVERYDRKRKLVIDPVFVYATYLGGSASDRISFVQLDSLGRLYIVGQTTSTDLPYTANAYDIANAGLADVFLAIIDTTQAGNFALVYLSYIGGSSLDIPAGLAVDSHGVMWVGGSTSSTNFPIAGNAFQSTGDALFTSAFIFQLDPSIAGTDALLYSTFISGTTGNDAVNGLALDSTGNVYVVGTAGSYDFPVTDTAFASVRYGPTDAFIAELNPSSSALLYSTYIGGEADDFGAAIAVAGPGKVYFAVNTQSAGFPTTGGAIKTTLTGGIDGVLGLMDLTQSGLNSLVYATYFGGSDLDEVRGIAVDANGNLLATGYTLSTDFPITGDAIQTVYNGNGDAFVAVANPNVPGFLIYSTYLGGSDAEVGYAIVSDASGSIYVTGYTLSDDFPTTGNAPQSVWGQGIDVFVTKLKPHVPGTAGLQYSTYIGSTNVNVGYALAVGSDGTTYVAGATEGLLPVGLNASQPTYGGGASDGFVVVISKN
jgi:hypothetical protein